MRAVRYRALLRLYRALLRLYRALLREYKALLREYKALLRLYRALLREYKALLIVHRALSWFARYVKFARQRSLNGACCDAFFSSATTLHSQYLDPQKSPADPQKSPISYGAHLEIDDEPCRPSKEPCRSSKEPYILRRASRNRR